jgi:hypothetical protein
MGHPQHGIIIPASPVVVLNALGYIGCKVVSTAVDKEVTNILAVRWFLQLEIRRQLIYWL